jgi:enterochelin esterase-like enzyme
MRRLLLPALLALPLLAACVPSPPVATPTPVSLKPTNLLTPRPTLPPATPTAVATAAAQASGSNLPPPPVATPTAVVEGTPVVASEPLQGFLRDDRLESPIIGESFAYRVYLPPDYQQSPQRRYPVLYLLHGAGGNYTEWTDSFLPEQIDRLIVADQIQPMIVVMPDDGETTYFANWDNGPRWGDYVADDVVTTIDQRYRTLPAAASRAIGGLSMGGLGALNLAFQHPDTFGVVGAHSPSIRLEPDPTLWFLTGQNFWEHNPLWLAQHQSGLEVLKIWLDAGTDDVWLPNIEAAEQVFVGEGLNVDWHEFPGPHEAEYWIEHLPDYLRFYSATLAGPSSAADAGSGG